MHEDLIAHLHDLSAGFGALDARRMFGGHGVYRDGTMIGLLSDETLYLKTDEQTLSRFQAAGCQPFLYTRRGETVPTSYWTVPEEAMDSPQEMRPWLALAWEAALRKGAKKKPAKKRAVKKAAKKKPRA
ncbi:hypothetical protein bcgnr5379_62700 [Bacillus cereus]|uniref:DNA transformation protein and related proteins n=1 Tax=Lysobacter enzymogenes TaxID=69 RepID=A0AAU9AIW5_LYSEN|nr:TfoX/Sxy family protein [Lysobacter enzymogenes]BAV99030.1 DNA transformation protein and related proteins [Lysobacter enzymogenes]